MTHGEDPTIDAGGSEPLIGRRVGGYRVLSLLGEGGFGTVYLAEQSEPVRRRVALKLIRPGMDSRAVIARFEAERQALALMDHPGLARVYDAGVTPEGRPYFAMELVRGEPIDRFCSGARLSVEDRARLIVQVAEAVHHAHMKGVVHRDLKPSNILVELVDRRPVVRVIDFGVAKAINQRLSDTTVFTEHGQMIGTPEYMSPEQARGDVLDVDIRADVYSIGAIFYQLLTGETPIDSRRLRAAGIAQIPALIEQVEPLRPSERVRRADSGTQAGGGSVYARRLRGDLDWIVMRCLEKDRALRYDSASALAADLERFLRDEPVEAGPPSAGYRLQKFVRRHRGLVAASACVFLALVLGVVGTSAGMAWAVRERDRARAAEAVAAERADEAVRARGEAEAVTKLLIGSIESVHPGEGRRDVTVAEVLEGMGAQAGSAFAASPGLEAAVRHALGLAYWALGDLNRAGTHLARALEVRERTLGADHAETVRVLANLAFLRHAQGRFSEAEPPALRALAWHERNGPGSRDHLGVLNNLAQLYVAMGRHEDALAMQTEVLEAQRRILGPDHPDTLGSVANLAGIASAGGELDRAELLLREAEGGASARLGPDHPVTLLMRHKLALLLHDTGRGSEALPIQRGVVESRRRVLGARHPDTIGSEVNLGLILRGLGRAGEALPAQVAGFEAALETLGSSHPTTFAAAQGLLEAIEALGWPEEHASTAESLVAFLRAASDRPGASPADLNACAWTLLTARPESLRDPAAALRYAQRACEGEAGGRALWQYLDTLALARHECGDHAGAVAAQREAVSLLPAWGEAYRAEMTERLRVYEGTAGGG